MFSMVFLLAFRRLASVPRSLMLLLCVSMSLSPLPARSRPAPVLDSGYVLALAAANHFLQAWQSGDVENGMALLTTHAKAAINPEMLDRFFSDHELSGYEIERGRPLKGGRYGFSVVLVTGSSKNIHIRRRFSSIVVVNTGNNDWAVDKLP